MDFKYRIILKIWKKDRVILYTIVPVYDRPPPLGTIVLLINICWDSIQGIGTLVAAGTSIVGRFKLSAMCRNFLLARL